jgi:hypothetical protein
LRSKNASTAS